MAWAGVGRAVLGWGAPQLDDAASVCCIAWAPGSYTDHSIGGVEQSRAQLTVSPQTTAGAAEAGSRRQLARRDSQRTTVQATEAARLETVLEVAGKCNAALREEDWELM